MSHGLGRDGWPSDATVIKSRDAEIESLRQQLAAANAEIERLKRHISSAEMCAGELRGRWAEVCSRLAASQLQNTQLRSLIDRSFNDHDHKWSDDAIAALALPADTSALEAMIAKAGEVMRERIIANLLRCGAIGDGDYINAIRALPGVTLEDIE